MLTEISIRNLAVIEQLRLTCVRGFLAMTGETGAGKSIVIDALSLIAGGRGSTELVRHGSEKAEIEALFDIGIDHPVWEALGRLGIEAEPPEPLLIRREITVQGKSYARINGQLVNLTMLREVGDHLINLHGQHEHQALLKTEHHLEWLDAYGGTIVSNNKRQYQQTFEAYMNTKKEMSELESGSKLALQMSDLYRFQVEEISAAALIVDEDEKLEDEQRRLANAEKMVDAISQAYDGLYGNGKALESISITMNRIEYIKKYDESHLLPLFEQVQTAYYQLEDAAFQLRAYRDTLEFEPDRLNQIEERLNLIASLRRKYGSTIIEILAHYEYITSELVRLDHKDERLDELGKKLAVLQQQLTEEARVLSASREETSLKLCAELERHLQDLNMERTRFAVYFEPLEDNEQFKFTKDGIDRIEFQLSANPGEPLRSLNKIASGGELSRIMLALKTIFSGLDQIPVLVFDEVDTGVSGRAAQAIAEKLANLSRNRQIFCVTHLPQVASMADAHYLIYKEVEEDRTFTRISHLADDERVTELARMLGGAKVTTTTLNHAREMIELARR
ncbi:MAG: DNA repair protein RecN [Paenibacillaceae bacterium]